MTATERRGRTGTTLPEFSLPKLDGGELNVADLQGKRFLLFFWGSW